MSRLGDITAMRDAFYKDWGRKNPYTGASSDMTSAQAEMFGSGANFARQAEDERAGYDQNMNAAWGKTLPPGVLDEYYQLREQADASRQKKGQMAALAAMGGVVGAGALGAGMLGSGAAGAAGGDLGMAGWMGAGAGEMGTGAAGAMEGIGGAGMDMFGGGFGGGLPANVGNLAGGFGAELGSLPGAGGAMGGIDWMGLAKQYGPDVVKQLMGQQGGGNQQQGGGLGVLGNLGLGGAGLLYDYYNRSKMPGVPDFMGLANKTAVSANPNQTNAQGDTSSWVLDPVTGQRTQNVKYGAANQQAFDQRNAMAQALRSKIQAGGTSQPLQEVNPNALWG